MLVRSWLGLPVLFAALAAVLGCGGGGSGSYATVSGVVTQNGAPIDGAKVTFYSTVETDGKKGGPYSAQTDSNGKYVIAMVAKEPGIPPGMYKVTVTKPDVRSGISPDLDAGQIEAAGIGKNSLPSSYESFNTTKLSATLEPGKNADVNFDLKGK